MLNPRVNGLWSFFSRRSPAEIKHDPKQKSMNMYTYLYVYTQKNIYLYISHIHIYVPLKAKAWPSTAVSVKCELPHGNVDFRDKGRGEGDPRFK